VNIGDKKMAHLATWERFECNVSYSGEVTFAEFIGAVISIHAHPQYSNLKYVIHDMSAVSNLDFSGIDMIEIVAHELGARYTNSKVRVAIVTSDTRAKEKIMEFKALTGIEIHIFDSRIQALSYAAL
jgi:MFS superfamily sulfate permease-like transporter